MRPSAADASSAVKQVFMTLSPWTRLWLPLWIGLNVWTHSSVLPMGFLPSGGDITELSCHEVPDERKAPDKTVTQRVGATADVGSGQA